MFSVGFLSNAESGLKLKEQQAINRSSIMASYHVLSSYHDHRDATQTPHHPLLTH